MNSKTRQLIRYLGRTEESIGMLAMFGMTTAFFSQIVLRYLFDMPLQWVEEVTIYLAIWCAFIGASLGARWKNHVQIGLLDKIAESKPYLYQITQVIGGVISSMVCAILCYWECCQVLSSIKMGMVSPMLSIPMAVPQTGIAYGLAAMSFYFLFYAVKTGVSLRKTKGRQYPQV